MRILVLRTDFNHHGENYGYKQILKGINASYVIGIDEGSKKKGLDFFLRKYPWLYEFEALKYRKKVDLIHIMYAGEYFRWSHRFFKNIPIVVTFHQPPLKLEKEIMFGNDRGRVGQATHYFNKDRFRHIAAAIVTNSAQKEVLKKVMDEDKIHVIPLGVHIEELNNKYKNRAAKENTRPVIVTTGEWLRDWDFYFELVRSCPQWDFYLVNRKLKEEYKKQGKELSNFNYKHDITDEEMDELILNADIQFLPVTGFAGSNALIHGFSLGCPLVLTDLGGSQKDLSCNAFVKAYQKGNLEDCEKQIRSLLDKSPDEKHELRESAHLYAQDFSWERITEKTIGIYKKVKK